VALLEVLATNKLVSVCANHHTLVAHAATALVKLEPLATILALFLNLNLLLLSNPLQQTPNALSAHTVAKNVVVHHVVLATDKRENAFVNLVILVVLAVTTTDVSQQLVTIPEKPSFLEPPSALFALTVVMNVVDQPEAHATDKRDTANVSMDGAVVHVVEKTEK